jgi:hypothetical protein
MASAVHQLHGGNMVLVSKGCSLAGGELVLASHTLPNWPFWETVRSEKSHKHLILLARPERFELPTLRFVVWEQAGG